jgi:hypothetical protein
MRHYIKFIKPETRLWLFQFSLDPMNQPRRSGTQSMQAVFNKVVDYNHEYIKTLDSEIDLSTKIVV